MKQQLDIRAMFKRSAATQQKQAQQQHVFSEHQSLVPAAPQTAKQTEEHSQPQQLPSPMKRTREPAAVWRDVGLKDGEEEEEQEHSEGMARNLPREDPTAAGGKSRSRTPQTSQSTIAATTTVTPSNATSRSAGSSTLESVSKSFSFSLPDQAVAEANSVTTMAKLLQKNNAPFDPFYFPGWAREDAAHQDGRTTAASSTTMRAPFAFFADTLADISSVSSRLESIRLLSLFFWALLQRSPTDLLPAVYLTINSLAPAHEGLELGVGDAILVKAVGDVCGMTEKRVREKYQETGDIAEVAQENKEKQVTLGMMMKMEKKTALTISHVFNSFKQIAQMSGKDVQKRRLDIIRNLLRTAKGPEVNFIVRALQGKMRIGLAEPTVLLALGYAFLMDFLGPDCLRRSPEKPVASKRVRRSDESNAAGDVAKYAQLMSVAQFQYLLAGAGAAVQRVFHTLPSLDIIVPALLKYGYSVLAHSGSIVELTIRPGLPIKPMLAHPTTGITAILDRLQGKLFTCEYKYDGERAQIHYFNGKFEVYSRNSENHTSKYPDVIDALKERHIFDPLAVTSFILDSEVVAVSETGELQAFQVLQHRGRKNISLEEVKIPVCVFAFDLMFVNGESLLDKTLAERRQALYAFFSVKEPYFRYARNSSTSDIDEIQTFLGQSIADGCEGLMVKTLAEDATYCPAKRSYNWLKLKKDYMDGCGDTLDLIVMGAYYGKGKRTGVFGGFLLGVYDQENEIYQTVCKIGTGFQDTELERFYEVLTPHITPSQPQYYSFHDNHRPDVWFTENTVWEIKCADLSISPVHKGALGLCAEGKGIALRFPRFIRIREDKAPTDCTSATQLAEMYKAQSLAQQGQQANDEDDEY